MPLPRPLSKLFRPGNAGAGALHGRRRGQGPARSRARLKLFRELPEHRRQAEALRALVKATAGSGKAFFQGLVAELAKALGVKYAFIGELLPGPPERVRAVAVWSDGVETESFEYELEGTPCANVVGKSLCLYPRQVQQRFPRDKLLARLGAESYLGIPLWGASGAAIGLLCVLDNRPMDNSELAESLMTVFAARAAAELERQNALEALKTSEAKYRTLHNSMMDAFGTADLSGRILECNAIFGRMLGYRPEELPGLTYQDITPERWHAFEAAIVERQVLGRGYSDVYEKEYRRKDGTVFPVELRTILLRNEAGAPSGMWAIVRDITQRKRAELLQAGERQVLEMIARRLPLDEALNEVCRFVDEIAPEALSSILLVEPDGRRLRPIAGPKLPKAWHQAITPLPIGPEVGSCGAAAFSKQRVIVSDIATDPLWARFPELTQLALKSGLRACWSTPILSPHGQVLGTFALYYSQPRSPHPEDLQFIEHVTHLARVAIEHHRAVEALRESEARYRALHQANPTMIFTLDAQGTILSVNAFAVSQLGYRREELEGHSILQVVHPEDRPGVGEQLQRCLHTPQQSCTRQFRKLRKDGAWLWVEEIAQGLWGNNGERNVLMVCQDITERRRAELELQKLAAVVQNSSDFIGICTPAMEPVFLNEAGRRMVGLDSMEEVRRTRVLDYFWPEDRPLIESQAIPTLQREGRWSGEVRFRHFKTGEPIYTIWNVFVIRDEQGRPVAWATNSPDLTRMKRAELALRESEARFSKAFHSNPCIVTITRVGDGRFIDVNEAFLRLFGFERAEVIGQTARGLNLSLNPQERPILMEKLQAAQAVRGYETRARRKDGALLDLLVYLERIELAGEPCVLSTAFDITERKAAEEALRRAHDELEERVRERTADLTAANQALQTFASAVAHDLRAPLRSLDGFSHLLRKRYKDKLDEAGRDLLERFQSEVQRMGHFIAALLQLSRSSGGELRREAVNLSQLALSIGAELSRQQPERPVEWVISPGLTAQGDPVLLRAVLENLLGNAWKFTAKTAAAHIEFGQVQRRGEPAYFVRDNGVGFDMDAAPDLFVPFQRLHDTADFPGTGIGLASVRQIIRRHGGEVWAEGALNHGATFYFTLP